VLRQVAAGVLVHQSEFCQSNAVIVQGGAGVLLIDPGVLGHGLAALADDLRELGQPVVAGFSTHPHWDHLLWHARLGAVRDAPVLSDPVLSDPRVGPSATYDWVADGHAGPLQRLARRSERDGTPG
jgi:glyoxylase-like metal-dependent hydrolase (beta-lactamase superfamily II)